MEPVVRGEDLGRIQRKIAISRYIFFLAVQAANYEAVIIPPLDVMIIHYSQLTTDPAKYRIDCEAICGRILNCNYRNFFIEKARDPAAAKETIAASKKIWNLMVRSAQHNLSWLRYDFWERRCRNGGGSLAPAANPNASFSLISAVPSQLSGSTVDEVYKNMNDLRKIDSSHDLSKVLDPAITSHFEETGDAGFEDSLESFFKINAYFIKYEKQLKALDLDWTRYVKYLALYANRVSAHRPEYSEPLAEFDDNFPSQYPGRATSYLGPHYDLMNNVSFADPSKYLPQPSKNNSQLDDLNNSTNPAPAKRTVSVIKRENLRKEAMEGMSVNPVPTLGIQILLFTHRTFHVKYFQTLTLLGIEDQDVFWENSDEAIKATKVAWRSLYDENYVDEKPDEVLFVSDSQQNTPMIPNSRAKSLLHQVLVPEYKKDATPLKSCINQHKKERKKEVKLCCGDNTYGVF